MFGALILVLAAYSIDRPLDINSATFAELRELPLDSLTAQRIYDYLHLYGRFNSIYDLLKIPGITPEKLDELKPLIYLTPRGREERRRLNIQRVQRRLASEDGPGKAVVEEWQDLLLDPLNINRADVDDLLQLENVSLVDAVAVVRYLKSGGKVESRSDLASRIPGLSTYAYRGIREYVKFTDQPGRFFSGNYRLKFQTDPGWETVVHPGDFASALRILATDTAKFEQAGYTSDELRFFRERVAAESAFRSQLTNPAGLRHRLRLRQGEHLRVGGALGQRFYESPGGPVPAASPRADAKGFITLDRLGPVKRLLIGDYRLVLGQGLLMDNDAELLPRVYSRTEGLFGDLSENPGFGLRGAAAHLNFARLNAIGFYSRAHRDAILNPDSTANWFIISTPRYPTFANLLTATTLGGNLNFDLSRIAILPLGTRLGVALLSENTSSSLRPDARYLDLPGDAEGLSDANYLCLDTGKVRRFYGADFRTVIENLAFEGEFARQHRGGNAWLLKARTQYDYLYLNLLYRRYDVRYANPYNRGYCEDLRFENTLLEKPYRLIDPAYSALKDFPMPKSEEGVYLEMRYSISRQVTFTRAYLDLWRDLAQGTVNSRFQAELEYRPVFGVRLRFKQKLQVRENAKPVVATRTLSLESGMRALFSLTNADYLTGEVRAARTVFTPTLKYNDRAGVDADLVGVQWEHNFSSNFSAELGLAAWRCAGLTEWVFEDNTIDFIDGQGFKWYLAASDRISDRLLFYLKLRRKTSDFPHTGLGNHPGVHYSDGGWVRDFVSRDSRFDITLQLDLFW